MMWLTALVSVIATVLFGAFAFQSIYPGDAGDLVTAAATFGIAHPPGYPLYTFLGWLVTRLPILTPAWRMAWISIIPHALTLGLVYAFVYRLCRQHIAAIMAVLLLGGNYLFFLYSVTPEVFGLLDLFMMLLLVLAVRLRQRFGWGTVLLFFFCIGLSLTHHHLIVFLFPSLFFYLKPTLLGRHWSPTHILQALLSFFLGLLPYGYVFIAAHAQSMVNWDRPTTLARFIQLVTRADYGTFVTGGSVGHSFYDRLLSVQTFLNFLVIDFTWVGIVLAAIGLWWLWKKNRSMVLLLGLSWILLGPGFVFYASFSTISRFVLGTVERFLLPSYIIFAIVAGIGTAVICNMVGRRISLLVGARSRSVLVSLCMVVFLLYPLTTGAMTLWRFWGSSTDQTTDAFIKDLMDSTPPDAMLLLSHDTPLFGAQYMRYAMGYRPDTIVIHLARLTRSDYHEVIRTVYPDIRLPETIDGFVVNEFILANAPLRPVVTNTIISTPEGWVWVPHGLVFVLTKKEEAPETDVLIAENIRLWESFHDPLSGILSRYNHLMLSNIRDEYASSAVLYGKMLVQAGNNAEAKNFFARAADYESDTERETAWIYLGLSQLFLNDCHGALESFGQAKQRALATNPEVIKYEAITYGDCVGDAARARQLHQEYDQLRQVDQHPLEQL